MVPPGPLFGLSGTKAESAKVTQSLFPPFHISCEPLQALELFGVGTCGLYQQGRGPHMAVPCKLKRVLISVMPRRSEWFCSLFWVNFAQFE